MLSLNRVKHLVGKQMTSQRLFSVKVGDKIPSSLVSVVKFDQEKGYVNEIVDVQDYFENKNIVLVGYPGAFTPTCMATHIPAFIEHAD
mmetsp:Transcript_33545/g.24192  ORF Transcript_33545/g.24192 Transcript_33545/m.24192 type:complete len:88 (-) Transcript_33545:395-658(-)